MELEYYTVDGSYGWNQEKFRDLMMKGGGCAAVTACDSMIYFSKYMGMSECCMIETDEITPKAYKAFSRIMKPYLHPRWQGIDSLDIYIDGLTSFLEDMGEDRIKIEGFSGNERIEKAKKMIKMQIDRGIPIPYLNLKHKDSRFKDFEWHWFMLTGYSEDEKGSGDSGGGEGKTGRLFMVKAVSYGEFIWMNFDELWETGYGRKGGMIIFHIDER